VILVTVGTQLPFDRMIRLVDAWAENHPGTDVFAQIGKAEYIPKHVRWQAELSPAEFTKLQQQASVVVSHAGMGTVLGSLELGKPVIVFPRRAALGEHRNDHQLATVDRLKTLGLVRVAMTDSDLTNELDNSSGASGQAISRFAPPPLQNALRRFIHNVPV